ncbi:Nramp family divalent metal transporter [Kangiella marina]|uniref:Nramp family divalent metal transporter n=1 Tax=Kangiella marina TaxID=1079178 RepID=A0ABP8IMC8_9GAMM
MAKSKFSIGPAALVAAAFIGPGTVTVATKAGANFGFSLLWALLFSVVATIILQEMTARLGVIGQKGLGQSIRELVKNPLLKVLSVILVVSAIIIGNAAYEGGNIAGATLGVQAVWNYPSIANLDLAALLIGLIAFIVLWTGSYRFIEKILIAVVLLMSVAFLVTFVITKPDLGALFKGLLVPSLPDSATLTVIALIGTTVVPYNLFLHSSSAKKKWSTPEELSQARQDIYISIPLGGLISIAIVSTAASAFFGSQLEIDSAADMAKSIEPAFGNLAQYMIALGLFAAGISSAITAPLASAYALSGLLNIPEDLKSRSFRLIWLVILVVGVAVASLGLKPVSVIWFAQVANGLLLPIIASFLLWAMNQGFLGQHKNNAWQNVLGLLVVIVSIILGAKSLLSAFELL